MPDFLLLNGLIFWVKVIKNEGHARLNFANQVTRVCANHAAAEDLASAVLADAQ